MCNRLYFLFLINWQERQNTFSLRLNNVWNRKEKQDFPYYPCVDHFSHSVRLASSYAEKCRMVHQTESATGQKKTDVMGGNMVKTCRAWEVSLFGKSLMRGLELLGTTDMKW